MGLQGLLGVVYPPQCLTCDERVTTEFGLCGACWRDTPFVTGLVCDACGTPLPGDDDPGHVVHCDDCLVTPRPWARGRAAMVYDGNARNMVLALKHGDRLDLVRPAAGWLFAAAQPLLQPDMIVVPVPLHWFRLFRRKYNQAALLSGALAKRAGLAHCPDLLMRVRYTGTQDHRDREGRMQNMAGAIRAHPGRVGRIQDRDVLLVDDVMTSGATLAASTQACLAAGARSVSVVSMARVTHHDAAVSAPDQMRHSIF
jgi:predicted amidophosphoribosyltransferase